MELLECQSNNKDSHIWEAPQARTSERVAADLRRVSVADPPRCFGEAHRSKHLDVHNATTKPLLLVDESTSSPSEHAISHLINELKHTQASSPLRPQTAVSVPRVPRGHRTDPDLDDFVNEGRPNSVIDARGRRRRSTLRSSAGRSSPKQKGPGV